MESQVMKAIGQEGMTILNNIGSLLEELKTSEGGVQAGMENREGQPPIETPNQISQKAEPSASASPSDMKKAEPSASASPSPSPKKVEKEITSTESDVATARDTPEDRILDALSEVDVENVDEVKKAVALVKKIQIARVQKSSDVSPLAHAIVGLTQVVKSIVDEQKETQMAIKNIIDGLGITEQMNIVQKSASSGTPIVNQDNAELSKFLKTMMTVAKNESSAVTGNEGKSNTQIALKNIEGSIHAMVGNIPSTIRSR